MNRSSHLLLKATATFLVLVIGAAYSAAQKNSRAETSKARPDSPVLRLQDDSIPVGKSAVVSGSRFLPNEPVVITVTRANSVPSTKVKSLVPNDEFGNATVFADDRGNFVYSKDLDAPGTFTITAKGMISNSEVASQITSGGTTHSNPKTLTGHKSCADINAMNSTFPTIDSDYGFRVREWGPTGTFPMANSSVPYTFMTGGAPEDPSNSVTTTSWDSQRRLSWSATRPIRAVIITKFYQNYRYSNVYIYDPESSGDSGPLFAPYNQKIYYAEFCFGDAPPPPPPPPKHAYLKIVKQASPASNYSFAFDAPNIYGLGQNNDFSLVDADSAPDNVDSNNTFDFGAVDQGAKTVNELDPGPYSLVGVYCRDNVTETEFGSYSLSGNSLQLTIASGDDITCTFYNDFTTAAEASIQGRVLDGQGLPVKDVFVTATNAAGTTRTARTNQFGFYRIDGFEAGDALLLEVASKRYLFPTQFVTLNDAVNNYDFSGSAR